MLNKLIKIDLRSTLKIAPILFGIGFFFALVSFFFSKFGDSTIAEVIADISKNFALSFAISGFINVVTRAIGVFWKKLYSDESYLTHTLPLSKKTIYLSKTLATIYSSLIALFAAFIILVVNYNLFENFDALKNFIEATAGVTGGNVVEFLVLIILVFFFEITTLISVAFCVIILRHSTTNLKATLLSAGSYLAIQAIFLLSLFLIGLFNPEVMELFKNSDSVSADSMKIIFYTAIIVYGLATVVMNCRNIKLLEKGVNVA